MGEVQGRQSGPVWEYSVGWGVGSGEWGEVWRVVGGWGLWVVSGREGWAGGGCGGRFGCLWERERFSRMVGAWGPAGR